MYGQKVEGGFRPHDNRRTAVTHMLQSGADITSAGSVVGHSRQRMTLLYGHPSAGSRRAAVEKLARVEEEDDQQSSSSSGRGGK